MLLRIDDIVSGIGRKKTEAVQQQKGGPEEEVDVDSEHMIQE